MKTALIKYCFFVISLSAFCSSETSSGALRFVRNSQPTLNQDWNSGIVQIYYNDEWGNICYDSDFGSDEADVVCHQLAYTGASSFGRTLSLSNSYGTDNSSTLIEDVDCSSNDFLVLLQCSFSDRYSSNCLSDDNDLFVNCYTSRIWDSPYPGQVRLTGGSYSNEGLVEIYCNGQWGTACDDFFDGTDARVFCNQLGYNAYSSYNHLSLIGNANDMIWLRSIPCSSSSLQCVKDCVQCPSSGVTSCTHSEDVTLECAYSSSGSSSSVTEGTCRSQEDTIGPSSVGAMRLLNGGSMSLYNTAGRVQVWYGGEWGNICDDDSTFGSDEADVICHQLGWSGAFSYGTAANDGFGTDYLPAVIDGLSCSLRSNYLTIFQCFYNTLGISSSCSDSSDVSVTCYTSRIWNSPYTGQIRLARGQYSNQGLLEVYCNGQWGTVCDDFFGTEEATVACRQLGYNGYYSSNRLSITGNISQSIWLDDVSCSSSSLSCLAYCATCPSGEYHDCRHSEDVTLECTVQTSGTVSTTTSTCQSADSGPTDDTSTTDSTTDSTIDSGIDFGGLAGGIVGGTFFIIFISIAIPFCIICCVGAGVRSSIRSRTTPRVFVSPATTTTTATTVVTETNVDQQVNSNAQSPPQPSYPAEGYDPSKKDSPPLLYDPPPSFNPYGGQQQSGYPQYPYPPAGPEQATPYIPPGYTTAPQQAPPSYSNVPPPYPT